MKENDLLSKLERVERVLSIELMANPVQPDFTRNYYVLEANGIYNW
jgi:hypothetical protein